MKLQISLVISLIIGAIQVNSFSVSVPSTRSVCKAMIPGHDKNTPQKTPSPFNVTTDINKVQGGETVEVTIYANEGRTFKGFYIQARDEKGVPIGLFNENTNAKTHSCGGKKSNAAHHVSPEEKGKVRVSWNAPTNYKGPIQFQATVVQEYTTFWTPIKADLVTIE